jgi:uncharacterized protein
MRIESGLEVPMRDGTVLRADAYRPVGAGPWPVLLARTPYGKQNEGVLERLDPWGAARRGYLVVIQDCRGRFASDGVWEPLLHEGADGYDTIAWAASLPDSTGRVGMYGPSYLGHTQRAAMATSPPGLAAAVPAFTWSDVDDGLLRRGGAYELGLVTRWTLNLGFDVLARRYAEDQGESESELAVLTSALDEFAARTAWELPADDMPTLRRLGLSIPKPCAAALQRTDVPTLAVGGWFDCFLQGTLDMESSALIVGPWTHDNQTRHVGEVDFGPAADAAPWPARRELDFLDTFLKPNHSEHGDGFTALVFVMGVDEWRSFPFWPPQSADAAWYLHPDSCLAPCPAPESAPDTFDHDADDPVPTLGGALLIGPDFPAGPHDQARIEKRDDVLVYTSETLYSPLEVIGRVRVHLFAESTAAGADWVARLCDVDPDGVSRNVTDGVLRTAQSADQPGEYVIDLWSTAHVFRPGHRIRVQIASSCFPRWDRHPASSRARHTVHHDPAKPSRIVLPIVLPVA